MSRRKKEPRWVHREAIACAAQRLFLQKGIDATSMDEIAKEAGYSKATLYVYFENKEEIVGVLVLQSMKKLSGCLFAALDQPGITREKYDMICWGLVQYQQEFPFYFKTALDRININFAPDAFLPEEQETFQVGETINERLGQLLTEGIKAGEIRPDIPIVPTIFVFWGMLSGLILTAINKQEYLQQELNLTKKEFLAHGFDTLYRSIEATKKD